MMSLLWIPVNAMYGMYSCVISLMCDLPMGTVPLKRNVAIARE